MKRYLDRAMTNYGRRVAKQVYCGIEEGHVHLKNQNGGQVIVNKGDSQTDLV